ncbi:ATPase, T2SS/T4P/T4SS family [Pseudomonas guariconensis]|uniref:ATPase, T2SS/T4P/T4SS family n=1 Tax=Pseudomonas guariconensis TaxID=1288410 RepID=UPI003906B1A9
MTSNQSANDRVDLAEANNITLFANRLEANDNFGRFQIYDTPPGPWKDFYDSKTADLAARANKRKSQNFTTQFQGDRFRCILTDSNEGLCITMRRLMRQIPRIEKDLKLDWGAIGPLMQGSGLTIFASAMGHGKSTTMISAIEGIGQKARGNLGTVEDPIEGIFPGGGVIQREVGTHVDTFQDAIRDFIRQFRQTIMVGEIRDSETAEAAVQAASLGHSVFATLHTDSAIDIPARMSVLLDAKYTRLLPTVMRGMWWQHLIRSGEGQVDPLPIYESLYVTNAVRQIIAAGPEALPQLMQEMHVQGRKNMAETAMHWVRMRKLRQEQVQQWLQPRGRINDAQLGFKR